MLRGSRASGPPHPFRAALRNRSCCIMEGRDEHCSSADKRCLSLHAFLQHSAVWRDGTARYSVQERRTGSASRVEPWISHLFTPDRAIGRGFFVFRSITEASLIRHFTPSSLRETSSVDAVIAFFTTTAENEKTKHGGQIARATDFEPCARNSNPTLIPDP